MLLQQSNNFCSFVSILYQPTFHCERRCHNCYVAANPTMMSLSRAKENDYFYWTIAEELIDLLFYSRKLSCEHLSIAVDESDLCKKIVRKLLWERGLARENDRPRFHFTARNIHTLGWLSFDALSKGDVISLSTIDENTLKTLEVAKPYLVKKGILLNFNFMQTIDCFWNFPASRFSRIFDQGYAILNKDVSIYKVETPELYHSYPYHKYYNSLIRDGYTTILPDKCWIESERYWKMDQGRLNLLCGAGTEKIMIWPNGSVSGCPYNSFLKPSETLWDGIQNAIGMARYANTHEMNRCKIKDQIREVRERQNNPERTIGHSGGFNAYGQGVDISSIFNFERRGER